MMEFRRFKRFLHCSAALKARKALPVKRYQQEKLPYNVSYYLNDNQNKYFRKFQT